MKTTNFTNVTNYIEKLCGFAANLYESCCIENSYELDACIP